MHQIHRSRDNTEQRGRRHQTRRRPENPLATRRTLGLPPGRYRSLNGSTEWHS
jgi:hypothetical protein